MKKKAILFLIVITILSLAGCGGASTSGSDDTSASGNGSGSDEYISALKAKVNQEAVSFGETITDISIEDKTVVISVDMSTADTSVYSAEEAAKVVFFRTTGAALEVEGYDDLWKSMKVDFGELGSITKSKKEAIDNGLGRSFEYDPDISWD